LLTRTTAAIAYRLDVTTGEQHPATSLAMNDLGMLG